MPKLIPCPACGGKLILETVLEDSSIGRVARPVVKCTACPFRGEGATAPGVPVQSVEEALASDRAYKFEPHEFIREAAAARYEHWARKAQLDGADYTPWDEVPADLRVLALNAEADSVLSVLKHNFTSTLRIAYSISRAGIAKEAGIPQEAADRFLTTITGNLEYIADTMADLGVTFTENNA